MTPRRRAIRMLRYTCAVGAFAAWGYAAPAAAQGFQGTPTVINGGVTITRTPGHDQITVDSAIAVIDWSSFNPSPIGPLDFLPAANSVTYVGTNPNYTVLNRILPNAVVPIMLNGAISSLVAGGAKPVTGGSIWFYTPGGFMVGSTATFSVGGLLLSANDIPLDINNGFNPNVVRFVGGGRIGSTSEVNIAAGAQINALNYVALIAPRIVQSGSIRADGQIAYIAAETGTLTMPIADGLFSIAIDAGGGTTVGGTAIVHSGTTGGPVTPGSVLNKRIYMVTVAKNNAVTMLLGGSIGYDLSAAAVGNTVVLSAGRDVVNGDAVMTGAAAGPAASIQLTNANLTTPLVASASGDITLLAQGGGTLSLTGNTLAVADGNVTARATTGTINASGNLTLQSARFGLDAGTAQVIADKGGQINVKGALGVFADGDGVRRGFKAGGNATGGVASVSADGGSIAANALTVSATGVAQSTAVGAVTSRGGTASVQLSNGATLNVGPIIIDASGGVGPSGTVANNPLGVGAAGIGGTASLTIDNAAFAPGGPLTITPRAIGGSGQTGGGTATGGTVLVQSINGGASTLPGLSIDATGIGGASAGGAGGAGQGGGATVRAQNGAISIAGPVGPQALTINAQGRGGTGTGGVVGATGGAILVAANGAPLSAGTTSLLADGNAGGVGGTVSVGVADAGGASGTMTLGDTTVSANGGNGGKIALTNTSTAASPALRLASLNANALGTVVAGGSSFALNAQGNRIAVNGDATIATSGDQTYAASGGGGFTVGNTLLATAGGAVSLIHTGNAGAVDTINAGDADVRGQSITIGAGAILGTARTVRLNAVTTIDAATVRAGTSIDATAGTTATLGTTTAGTSLNVNAGTAAALNNATAGTALTVIGGTTATLDNGTAGTTLTVTGGTTVTLGNGTAGTALNATGQTIAANGTLRSPQIAFRSAAMQVGGASQIGVGGLTQNVSFTNAGAGASFIGGVGGAGYSLTNAGLSRVQSRDITIALPGDATVGNLALTGAAAPAPVNLGGTFSITTPGTVTVNGAVALSNATAANGITLNAGPAIRVITPTGSIAMLSATGAPAGTLTLTAATVAVASQTALTDIATATDVDTRNARLAVNDGPISDQGYLIAGAMRFSVTNGLYIQNSGAVSALLTARRGFTVGDGGVTISTLGGQRVGIVINGRQLLANGTIITGAPLIPRITLNNGAGGAALFDLQSTVNGCKIILGVCPGDFVKPQTLVAIRDTIGLVNGGRNLASAVNGIIPPIIVPVIGIEGLDPYSVEPPIDEPVIGIGNEDVWSDGTKP